MEQMKIMKDCEVEVSSEEEGFEDAWFRAVLEGNPTNSAHKKLRVRYLTLLHEDGSSPLVEHIEERFIRPVPPENQYDGVVLEEGLVVDADHKDGWWTGVVIKKMEDDKYLVYFNLPPDIIRFQRKHLRPHLNWTGTIWVRPDIKELDKSMSSSGKMVEVSSAKDVGWFSAMIIKEIGVNDKKKFIVKDWDKYLRCTDKEATPNYTVGSIWVRPTPPPSSVDKYTLLERVEAFRGSRWYKGLVRGILPENHYTVYLEDTKKESTFKHSDLRPLMVWEDGVWDNVPKARIIIRSVSNALEKKPTRSSSDGKPLTPKRATKHMRSSLTPEEIDKTHTEAETVAVAVTGELGKKKADAVMNDITLKLITPQVTPIEKKSVSPITPSPVILATALKQIEAETEEMKSPKKTLAPMKNQKGLENNLSWQEMSEENSKDKSRKRKREKKLNSYLNETGDTCNGSESDTNDTSNNICVDDVDDQPLSAWINLATELSSEQSPKLVKNSAAVDEETQAKGTLTISPFTKKLPFWKTYESEEVYNSVPQNPHFSPLVKVKEDIREWSAVGMMVSFYGLLKEVKDLQLDVSSKKLSSLSSSFSELEKHGFDVATPQSRIKKVLSLQNGRAKKTEERKCLEKKIQVKESGRHKLEAEMVDLERKILELNRQEAVVKEKKEAADKVIVEMRSCAETIDQEIEDMELEFVTSMLAPL